MGSEDHRPPYYLGLDLGGTNIKGGVVDEDGRPLASVKAPTRAELGPEVGLQTLEDVARRAIEASGVTWAQIKAIGLGSAGTLDTAEGRIINATNLPLWNGFPIAPRLAERLDRSTILLNDANAAAFGEYWAGAGRNTQSLVLFTLGTGIGCGIIESGRILEGRHGMAGECGHMTINFDSQEVCSCGRRGHLEAYASATSVVRRAARLLEEGCEFDLVKNSTLRPIHAEGRLTFEAIARSAKEGDAFALHTMSFAAKCLAIGAVNVMHTIDPDLVLFGGGMIEAGPSFLDAIRDDIREYAMTGAADCSRVEFAELGGDAGFIGAAGWARKAGFAN